MIDQILSQKERILYEIAKEYGKVTINQANNVYSSKNRASNALRRMVNLKILKPSRFHGVFELRNKGESNGKNKP